MAPEAIDNEKPRVTINVTADGSLLLAGRAVTPDELKRRLAEQRAADGDDLEVRIRSDRSVPYSHVEPIMLSSVRAGIWNVTFSVYRPEDGPLMRRPSIYTQRQQGVDVKMTPMIDVVFLLLVFFVWTASFQVVEHLLPSSVSTPSTAGTAQVNDPPPEEFDFDQVVVRVLWRGDHPAWTINGDPIATLGRCPRAAGDHCRDQARRSRDSRSRSRRAAGACDRSLRRRSTRELPNACNSPLRRCHEKPRTRRCQRRR